MDHPEPQFPHLPHRLVALQVKRRSGTQFLASPAWVSSLPSTRRELLKPYLAGLGEKLRAQGVRYERLLAAIPERVGGNCGDLIYSLSRCGLSSLRTLPKQLFLPGHWLHEGPRAKATAQGPSHPHGTQHSIKMQRQARPSDTGLHSQLLEMLRQVCCTFKAGTGNLVRACLRIQNQKRVGDVTPWVSSAGLTWAQPPGPPKPEHA